MSRGDDKIIAEAKSRRDRAETWESFARSNWKSDVRFANGDDINRYQWGDAQYSQRVTDSRPCLTVNKTRQHVLMIVNDARQNKAAIKITPTGDGATMEAAQIYEGICRHVEYQSQATSAYDKATWDQVQGGVGYWRVGTRYVDQSSMDQELYIDRIADALSVLLDPDIKQYDGADGKFGFIDSAILTEEAEKQYPDIKGQGSSKPLGSDESWHGSDYTRVVEYFRVKEQSDKLHVLPDGSTMKESEAEEQAERLAPHAIGMMGDDGEPMRPKQVLRALSTRSRAVNDPVVEWFKIVGDRIVDRKDTVFNSIPIARVIGEETVIEGQMDRKGHVRFLRDSQRIYNYWNSAAVEFVALQGKSPFIGTVQAIEGYERLWETANVENHSMLPYNPYDDQGRPVPKPERAQPPVMPQAFVEGMKIADEQMMMVSGQYQAELGRPGNETSGVAIQQRQRQGDTATYHYIDHLAQAIRYTGRLIVHAAPKVYDTERVLQIMAADGTQTDVHIRPDMPDAHAVMSKAPDGQATPQGMAPTQQDQLADSVRTLFNPSVGRYSVEADVGPSFGTQRQEAFNAFSQMVAQNKELMSVAGDLLFKNADFPGADEMAERLKRMLPQAATGGPSPDMMKLQQQLQTVTQHGSAIAKQADQQIEAMKAQITGMQKQLADKDTEMEREQYNAETRRMAAIGQIDPAAMMPIIRQMVSEVLQMPAVPVIQAHQTEDAMHAAALARANGAMDGAVSGPNGLPMTGSAPQ